MICCRVNDTSLSIKLAHSHLRMINEHADPVLDIGAGTVLDMGSNPVAASMGNSIALQGQRHHTPPNLQSFNSHEVNGTLAVRFNEPVRNPTSDVTLSKMRLTGPGTDTFVPLTGSNVSAYNSTTLHFSLTPSQITQIISNRSPDP